MSSMNKNAFYVFPERLPENVILALQQTMQEDRGKLYPKLADGTEFARYQPNNPLAQPIITEHFPQRCKRGWRTKISLPWRLNIWRRSDHSYRQSWISVPFAVLLHRRTPNCTTST